MSMMDLPYSPLEDEDDGQSDPNTPRTKYVGCIGIKTSMRSISLNQRSEVCKEAIRRLCEANKIKRNFDRKRFDTISDFLDDKPNLQHSGTDVQLCVTSSHLNVIERSSQQIIIQHEMPNVSFACSGDDETIDFVAYVAKDSQYGRASYIFECGYTTAKSVLQEIARGFHLRQHHIMSTNGTLYRTSTRDRLANLPGTMKLTDSRDVSLDPCYRSDSENQQNESVIAATRAALELEPWFHGSYLSREESEKRLKQDGDFLVRESMLDPGHFVLSVLFGKEKMHLLFDSMGQVHTKDMTFKDISHLVKYHHDHRLPIIAEDRIVYLRHGVKPISKAL